MSEGDLFATIYTALGINPRVQALRRHAADLGDAGREQGDPRDRGMNRATVARKSPSDAKFAEKTDSLRCRSVHLGDFARDSSAVRSEWPNTRFDKATLAWTLPWDADWVTAVAFLGPHRRVAAGNNLGEILAVGPAREGRRRRRPSPCRRLDGHTNVIIRLAGHARRQAAVSRRSYDHTIRFWDMTAEAERRGDRRPQRPDARRPASAGGGEDAGRRSRPRSGVSRHGAEYARGAPRLGDGHGPVARREDCSSAATTAGTSSSGTAPAARSCDRWQVKGWAYAVALSPDASRCCVSERAAAGVRLRPARRREALGPRATASRARDLAARTSRAVHLPPPRSRPTARCWPSAAAARRRHQRRRHTGRPGHRQEGADADAGPPRTALTDLAFHPDGKHLASCGRDTSVSHLGHRRRQAGRAARQAARRAVQGLAARAGVLGRRQVAGGRRHGRGGAGVVAGRLSTSLRRHRSCGRLASAPS